MKKILSSILVSASLLVAPFALANSEETTVETTAPKAQTAPAGKKLANDAAACHKDEKTQKCMCDGKEAPAEKCAPKTK